MGHTWVTEDELQSDVDTTSWLQTRRRIQICLRDLKINHVLEISRYQILQDIALLISTRYTECVGQML